MEIMEDSYQIRFEKSLVDQVYIVKEILSPSYNLVRMDEDSIIQLLQIVQVLKISSTLHSKKAKTV